MVMSLYISPCRKPGGTPAVLPLFCHSTMRTLDGSRSFLSTTRNKTACC
ncbi:unnamed protein product [Amoebophrya sp. A25]|nr:unnamed protein product [Amoebophrya sp. A25]|eukprot:GSA25T00002195001.1